MNYNATDIEVFQQQKDFIDTVIVPLIPIDFSPELGKQFGSAAQYLNEVVYFVEKQFKGRIFLLPAVHYFHNKDKIELNDINDNLINSGFKHVLFVTTDKAIVNNSQDYHILWLPAIPIESMDKEVKLRIMQEQLNIFVPKLTQIWHV